jgi:hypothetical protein
MVTPTCNDTEILSGGTATATCGPANSQEVMSVATYSGLFSGDVSTGNYENMYGYGFGDGLASITDSNSEYLMVAGGTGAGTLTLNYSMTGQGGEIGNTRSEMSFGTNFGGFAPGSFAYVCDDQDCSWSASGTPESLTIPFTFGTPFLFEEEFELTVSVDSVCGGCGASASGQVSQTGFSVVDSNSNPVPGAQLTETPEPGSLGLAGLLIALVVRKSRFPRSAGRRM